MQQQSYQNRLQDIDFSLTVYPVSLITDSNLSPQDIFYIRYLYAEFALQPFSVDGTLLRYIWGVYGFNFSALSNQSLRYAAMALAAIHLAIKTKQVVPIAFYEYMSQFHEGLLRAIQSNTIDETHLFALHFAICCAGNSNQDKSLPERKSEASVYSDGFLAVLHHLTVQISTTDSKFPSRHVWRFLLSFRRRVWHSTFKSESVNDNRRLWSMHLLDSQLSNNSSNLETNQMVVGCRSPDPLLFSYWDTGDILSSLLSSFRVSYSNRAQLFGFLRQDLVVAEMLDAVRGRANGFEKLHRLEKEYEVALSGVETNV